MKDSKYLNYSRDRDGYIEPIAHSSKKNKKTSKYLKEDKPKKLT